MSRSLLTILLLGVAAALATVTASQLPEIRRYLRIRAM